VDELASKLQQDLNTARKAQDKSRTLVLGTILADVKNRRIELRRDPTDAEVIEVLQRGIKKRRESVEMYERGKRDDLAAKERDEITMLQGYLPPAASDDDIRAAIRAVLAGGAASIGSVMGAVTPQFKGRAEGSRINAIAREELARQG
jgi:uncharacterized protein